MLQGYGDTVLRAKALQKELAKARKHSAVLRSKIDGAFAQYHNEVQDMQAKSNELARRNRSLRQKNKGMPMSACRVLIEGTLWLSDISLELCADLEAWVEQLKASETDMKNFFYREKDARDVLEYDYKQLAHECNMYTWSFGSPRIVTLSTTINLCRSLVKTVRSCGVNSRSLKKPRCPSLGCWYLTRADQRLLHWSIG
jgi:hypothetical protein